MNVTVNDLPAWLDTLFVGLGVGLVLFLAGSVLGYLIDAIDNRWFAPARLAKMKATATAEAHERYATWRAELDAKVDAECAVRLADLDARIATANERLVTPEDSATV